MTLGPIFLLGRPLRYRDICSTKTGFSHLHSTKRRDFSFSMAHETREEKLRAQIGSGFYYSDFPSSSSSSIPQLENQMQGFESNPELFNLQSGIEMLGFPWKNLQQRERSSLSGFLSKTDNNHASSSKTVADASTTVFFQPDFRKSDFAVGFSEPTNENLMAAPDSSWQENRLMVDDSSLRCVFPCEGSERQSHGLSLSLCPNKVSSVGLQSFELRESNHQNDIRFVSPNSGDGFFGKTMDLQQQHQNLLDGRSYPSMMGSSQQFHLQQLKSSKYLRPTQELLNEFCNLGSKQDKNNSKNKFHKTNQCDEGVSSKNQSLYSLDFLALQKRKAKLLAMLEEVDRRYRQYCEQMRSVVSSFEAVAGAGAASVYSSLALKAMSRHFRCLRDGLVGQIQVTKKAMGEKDAVAPGTTRGETPRLKLLDQTLRQQRALQQMGMMESHPWRPQRGLPERSVSVLRAWLFEHFLHPYPSDVDKHILARQTGLSRSQVSNWFINARVRLWKPMVEEMYLEETKEQNNKASDGGSMLQDNSRPHPQHPDQIPSPNPDHDNQLEQKPTPEELADDPESLSSIISSSDRRDQKDGKGESHQQQSQFARAENFGVVDLDFSNYSHAAASTVAYGNSDCANPNFGSGVSLTLGLQQHSGGGVSLSFSPASQHSLFFSRQHMEECPPMQYSMLDGETQNLPYRNLMGAQLLHDLAG